MDRRFTTFPVIVAFTYIILDTLPVPAYSQGFDVSENGTGQLWSPREYDPQRKPVERFDYGYAHYFDQGNAYDPYEDDPDFRTPDTALKHRTRWKLHHHPGVNDERISVQVKDGTVILRGHVEDREEMIDVVELAYEAGARTVSNRLRLMERTERPLNDLSDRELGKAVEHELDGSPFVNSNLIRVRVDDGIVILAGRVNNHEEIEDAVEIAYKAGARKVRDRLWIDPSY